MNRLFYASLLSLAFSCAYAAPQDAEKFTHIAGLNLAGLYSFDDIADKFGKSKVVQSGDAGDYEARICYQTADSKTIVVFFHGEVDWGFTIRKPTTSDSQCQKSNALTPSQINVAGIRLGMDMSEYISLVGEPKKVSFKRIDHEFQYVHRLADSELRKMREKSFKNGYKEDNPEELRNWDVIISLEATFKHNLLTSIRIYRVETN